MRKQFWAFITREEPAAYAKRTHTLRISSDKETDPRTACIEQFGCVLRTLLAKPLGSNVRVLRTDKLRIAALRAPTDVDKNEWRAFPWGDDDVLGAGPVPVLR